MTPELEAQMVADMKAMKDSLTANAAALEAAKVASAAKDAELADLKTKTNALSQDAATSALKAKFPDVPMETLLALPEAAREAQGKVMQDTISKVKAPTALKTGPDAWGNVGGVGPTAEAEDHAQLIAREQAREKAVQSGDALGVLRVKARDTVDWLQKHYSTR